MEENKGFPPEAPEQQPPQSAPNYYGQPPQYQQQYPMQQQQRPNYAPRTTANDPNIAWLELIGLVGFLGIGYMVAGRVTDGVIRMVGFIALMTIGWIITAVLSLVLVGICLIPFMLVAQIGIPIWSAVTLKKELEAGMYY